MDSFCLEEDEVYQVKCGELFYTTKGRVIFHCTLCEKRFDRFDMYDMHLNEHITTTIDEIEVDDSLEYIENEKPLTFDDYEIYEEQEVNTEHDTIFENEETAKSDMETQNFIYFESEEESTENTEDVKNTMENSVVTKKPSPNKKIDILEVTRQVRSVKFPKSLRTPEEARKHKCPVCGAGFKERNNMNYHLKRHSNKRDHKCPECEKTFYTRSEVRVHLRSHSQERPFLCNICGNSYGYNSRLLAHLRRHSNQRNHKCEVCERAFYSSTELKRHMIGHSSERPFACDICAADFSREKALKNHLKLHANKKEYKCNLCAAEFNQRAGLSSHVKVTHKMSRCNILEHMK